MKEAELRQSLESIRSLVDQCLANLSPLRHPVRRSDVSASSQVASVDMNLQIANKIGDCDEADAIRACVLDAKPAEGKILLPFFIASRYFENIWLTTGDVERVTAELGVKIDRRNVANYVQKLRKFLESKTTRKRGQPTPYRLNRRGIVRFEEILKPRES